MAPKGMSGSGRNATVSCQLLEVARASLRQAEQVRRLVSDAPGAAAQRVRAGLDRFGPLVARVITQAERRVLRGEPVPAAEKVLSLFEPHTALIRRGKARQPTEFGNRVVLDEVDGGLISRYAILPGNPSDARSVPASLEHHRARFGRPPRVFAGDRGAYSPENERRAREMGVEQVALPQPGAKGAARRCYERQGWFRRAQRFRAGIEGRISVLRRRFGLRRGRYHGAAGMERWVGWGILAHNLRTISQVIAGRRPRRAT